MSDYKTNAGEPVLHEKLIEAALSGRSMGTMPSTEGRRIESAEEHEAQLKRAQEARQKRESEIKHDIKHDIEASKIVTRNLQSKAHRDSVFLGSAQGILQDAMIREENSRIAFLNVTSDHPVDAAKKAMLVKGSYNIEVEPINLDGVLNDVTIEALSEDDVKVKSLKLMITTDTPAAELPERLLVKPGDSEDVQRYANMTKMPPEICRLVHLSQNGTLADLKEAAKKLVERLDDLSE